MGLDANPCMGIAETHAWVLSPPPSLHIFQPLLSYH